jgi:hypothetical protein
MAKVTKWQQNTIPVAKNLTLFGQRQLDLEGNIEQTASNKVTVWNTTKLPRESVFPSMFQTKGNFEAAKAACRVQRVKELPHSPPLLPPSDLQHAPPRLSRNFCDNSPQKLISLEKFKRNNVIFFADQQSYNHDLLTEITNECFVSHNNPLIIPSNTAK